MLTVDLSNLPKITNPIYYPYFFTNKKRFEVYYGGAGSGKSVFVAQKIVYRIITEQNHKFLILRKVGRTLRDSVFVEIINALNSFGLVNYYQTNKTDMSITLPIFNSTILFKGMDDSEKIKSISGITGMWMEEASDFLERDFTQLNLRLRGKTKYIKQIYLSFNPVSALSWLKKRFFDTKDSEVQTLKTTYKDNRFIDRVSEEQYENLKFQDKTYYEIYCLGNWGIIGNLIYTNFQAVDDLDKKEYSEIVCGLDFGYNHPSALVKVAYHDGEVKVLDEVYQSNLTNQELIKLLEPYREYLIVCDCAEPDRIEEIRQAGFNAIACKKGAGSLKFGIDWLKRHKILIDKSCINTINEIQTYHYKEDKDGNVLDEPVNLKDDAMSALRYATEFWQKENVFEYVSIGKRNY